MVYAQETRATESRQIIFVQLRQCPERNKPPHSLNAVLSSCIASMFPFNGRFLGVKIHRCPLL